MMGLSLYIHKIEAWKQATILLHKCGVYTNAIGHWQLRVFQKHCDEYEKLHDEKKD